MTRDYDPDYGPDNGAAGDPRTPDDDRDIMDIPAGERHRILFEMNTVELVEIIDTAIATVIELRREIARFKAYTARAERLLWEHRLEDKP